MRRVAQAEQPMRYFLASLPSRRGTLRSKVRSGEVDGRGGRRRAREREPGNAIVRSECLTADDCTV